MKKLLFLSIFTVPCAFASDNVFKRDAKFLKDAQYLIDCRSQGKRSYAFCEQEIVNRYTHDCENMLSTPFARAACMREKMAFLEQKIEKLIKEHQELEKLISLMPEASASE